LPAGTMQAALQRNVRLSHNELSLQRDRSSQVEEETLSRPVPPNDKPDARSPLLDPPEIIQYRCDFVATTYLNVAQADSGNNASPQRLQDRVPFPRLYGCAHS
jgi:hypothetical protein